MVVSHLPDPLPPRPRIRLIACGGAGCNGLFRLADLSTRGFDLLALVTEPRELVAAQVTRTFFAAKLGRGKPVTGYGDPERGREAVQGVERKLSESLSGSTVVFVLAGLGGGTGTGAAPAIARIARNLGALTIGVAYLPFTSEGAKRLRTAREGVHALRQACDQVVLLSNQSMLERHARMPLDQSFRTMDELAARGMIAVAAPLFRPESVDIGLHDMRAIFRNGGLATIGHGESIGPTSSLSEATAAALGHPFLREGPLEQARGALLWGVTGRSAPQEAGDASRKLLWSRLPLEARTVSAWTVDGSPSMEGHSISTILLTGFEPTSHASMGPLLDG